jgi:hypothetical protein
MQQAETQSDLRLERLVAKFKTIGFKDYRAIAEVVSDTTGRPFPGNYRTLLALRKYREYTDLLEHTLETIKNK